MAFDGIGKIEIDRQTGRSHSVALVAHFLRTARGNIARHQISEAWVASFEIVIALIFRYVAWRAFVASLLRDERRRDDFAVDAEFG